MALITGGSRGLGRAMAFGFARNGATVVVASRKEDACRETAAEITAAVNRPAFGLPCHVGVWSDCDDLVGRLYDEFGRIDVLVNNAGMSPRYPAITDVTEELFDKVIGVNLRGPFRLSALIGSRMAEAGRGSILNVSSFSAVPLPPNSPMPQRRRGSTT